MLDARPNEPTMTTSLGAEISVQVVRQCPKSVDVEIRYCIPGVVKNLPIASSDIEKQSAKRKTPLTSAARISARCHPYVYRELDELSFVNCSNKSGHVYVIESRSYTP